MAKKLQDALLQQKELNEQVKLTISGKLGIPLGGSRLVEVPNRNSFVYVQLRDNQNEVIQAFNNKVAPSYGLPVVVQREGNRYIVLGVDTQRYQNVWNSFAPYLPRHGNTHSRLEGSGGGGDVTWVASNQFMPLLSIPSGSSGGPNVVISPHTIQNISGGWTYVGNTGTQSLLSYIPIGGNAVMVLVYLDRATGNPGIAVGSGSLFANTLTGTSQIVPYIPSLPDPLRQIPIGAVRLVTGTAYIGWDNIYDIRQFIQYIATGTSGGSGGLDTGTANALYLRLDTTNDPLTGRLDINPPTGTSTLSATSVGNVITSAFSQYMAGNQNVNNPLLYLYRSPVFGTGTFSDSVILIEQERISGLISGKILSVLSDGTERVFINPSAQGTGTNTMLDGDFVLSPGGMLLQLKNNGTTRFYVNASGTAHSNNVPLIKEAPVDGNSYARKNAGWEVATAGSNDGWVSVTDTWTRTGNHSFTLAGDFSSVYQVGTKLRYKDGGDFEYGVVKSVSFGGGTTTVTLLANTNYAMAAGTITDTYFSYNDRPEGFPLEFDITPIFSNLVVGNATVLAKTQVYGGMENVRVHIRFGNTTQITGSVTMASPMNTGFVTGSTIRDPVGIATYLDASPLGTTLGNVVISAANTILLQAVNTGASFSTLSGIGAAIPFTWTTSDELSFFADHSIS